MTARTPILSVIVIGCFSVSAGLAQRNSDGRSIAQQAQAYFLQARQGDPAAAERAVELLEEATAATPTATSLWVLLANGYLMKVSTLGRAGAPQEALSSNARRAVSALDRVLAQDPSDAQAISSRGLALTILGGIERNQDLLAKGIDDLNRAVALNPKDIHLRLRRTFSTLNMPEPVRQTALVIEDLALSQKAGFSNQRAVDTLHILLGDVYAETGRTREARLEYEAAAGPASTTREPAQSRLVSLEQGSVPSAQIASFRSGLGTRCTMCHTQ